jgi:dihydrofolate reductase
MAASADEIERPARSAPSMRRLIYSMGVSLDGYIADRSGAIDWSAPGEELHRFHNQQAREVGVQLYGRRLYEVMRPWETLGEQPDATPAIREFAAIWRATPKLVFSTTLDAVEGPETTLVREDPVETVARIKQEPGKDLAVGGAGLAGILLAAGLVDEIRVFVSPVLLGGGTRFFPPLDDRVDLNLVDTRTFGSRVVYLAFDKA